MRFNSAQPTRYHAIIGTNLYYKMQALKVLVNFSRSYPQLSCRS